MSAPFRRRLLSGELLIGSIVSLPSPEIVELLPVDGPIRQGIERGRADELFRRLRHHDGNAGPGLHELTAEVGGLVGGNAAGDAQQDFPTVHRGCSRKELMNHRGHRGSQRKREE